MENNENKVIRSASRDVDRSEQPFSLSKLRERILIAAGVSDEELGELTRESLTTLKNALSATRVTPVTFEGQVTDTFESVDYPTRVKAASSILQIIGVSASKWNSTPDNDKHGPISVTVNLGGDNGQVLITNDGSRIDLTDIPQSPD